MSKIIKIQGIEINIRNSKEGEYISLTDMARYKNPSEPKDVVKNWMRTKFTVHFLGLWEKLNNINFKGVEFDPFEAEAGDNAFTMSPERWIRSTAAIGISVKRGNTGGTFAHK